MTLSVRIFRWVNCYSFRKTIKAKEKKKEKSRWLLVSYQRFLKVFLTDNVRPKFEALGLLEYEHAPDDFECDWTELKKPLETFDKIPEAI